MSIKFENDSIESSSGVTILDFSIDTSGIQLFDTNCRIVESKESTYSLTNCTTVNCTTINCTTVKCTTVKCTTVDCTTINCATIKCNSADTYFSTDS